MTTKSYTAAMAQFASDLKYEDLPKDVIHAAKRCILDTIGCGIYGSVLPWSTTVMKTMQRLDGGGEQVTIWGTDQRMSPPGAALVNGTMVHSFEFDDLHKGAIIHPGGVSLPAILALAESELPTATGKDLVVAVVVAYEISIRVGLSTGLGLLHRGWHNNGVLGTFGGATGAGKLLGLDTPQMMDAIGMAATQSSGLMSAQFGSMVKRMHAGKAAQSGLYAATLAQDGFRGIRNVFEVDYGGFHNTFTTEYSLEELSKGLGEQWEITRMGFKPYPACGSNHTSIDAIVALYAEHEFTYEDVVKVEVEASTATHDHVGWPYEPDTVTTAQMNLSYAIACALVNRDVTVANFDEDVLDDPTVLALTKLVKVTSSPAIDAKGRSHRHEINLTLTLSDGRELRKSVSHARGSEQHPLSDEELDNKFVSLVESVLGSSQAETLRSTIRDLENVDSAAELARALGTSSL